MSLLEKLGVFALLAAITVVAVIARSQAATYLLFVVAGLCVWNWPRRT